MHSHQRDGWVGTGTSLGEREEMRSGLGRVLSGGDRGGALSAEGRDGQGRGSARRGRGLAGAGPGRGGALSG